MAFCIILLATSCVHAWIVLAEPALALDWRNSKYDTWSTHSHWRCNAPDVINPGVALYTNHGEPNSTKRLLLFGGRFKKGNDASNLTYSYSFDARRWSLIQTATAPCARVKPSLFRLCNNQIFLFGGYSFRDLSEHRLVYCPWDMWKFNTKTYDWKFVRMETRSISVSSSLSNSRVVSIGSWRSSCDCSDTALLLSDENFAMFWRLHCTIDVDDEMVYDWITLHSPSASPLCGLLNTVTPSKSDYSVYLMNCKSELWHLSLLTSTWTRLAVAPLQSNRLSLAFFFEPRKEYVLFSRQSTEVFVFGTKDSNFSVQSSVGTWVTDNSRYSHFPSAFAILYNSYPVIYVGKTSECWQELWWFRKESNKWKWGKLGEPLLAPTSPHYYSYPGYQLGNEGSMQSFRLINRHVFVFLKRLSDRWISERVSPTTVVGPQVWSLDVSRMTWWSYDVARSLSHELIHSRWCGSVWLNDLLVISTFRPCARSVELWSYDIGLRSWRELRIDFDVGDAPKARCGHSMVAVNSSSGLLFGGKTICNGIEVLCDLWHFQIYPLSRRVQWSLLGSRRSLCNDSSSPRAIYGHRAVRAGTDVIVYGGIDNLQSCRSELWSYQFFSNTWSKLDNASASPKLSPSRLCSCSTAATKHAMWLAILCDSTVQRGCSDIGFQTWIYLFNSREWILLSRSETYESGLMSNMAFLDDSTLAMFDPYRAALLTLKAGCPKGFASEDVMKTSCRVCNIGTFAAAGDKYCKACPRGLTTKNNRCDSVGNCSLCRDDFCSYGNCFVTQANEVPTATCVCRVGYSGQQCDDPTYIMIGVGILAFVAALSIAVFKGVSLWRNNRRTESALREELSRMSSAWQVQRDEVNVGRQLGSGAFGDVFEAKYRGLTVAVKMLREWEDARSSYEFQREILFMQTIRHPNIVLFIGSGSCEVTRIPFLVLEYMSRGSLRDLLYNNDVGISINQKLSFATDVARGMRFLHGLNPPRIHRDLKSANLLVTEDWMVKVSDFGLGRTMATGKQRKKQGRQVKVHYTRRRSDSEPSAVNVTLLNPNVELSLSNVGTARWCAPELLAGQLYDVSVDIFSFGILLWEIWCRRLPFDNYSFNYEAADAIGRGERPTLPTDCSVIYSDIMKQCWSQNSKERPDFVHVLASLKKLLEMSTV